MTTTPSFIGDHDVHGRPGLVSARAQPSGDGSRVGHVGGVCHRLVGGRIRAALLSAG